MNKEYDIYAVRCTETGKWLKKYRHSYGKRGKIKKETVDELFQTDHIGKAKIYSSPEYAKMNGYTWDVYDENGKRIGTDGWWERGLLEVVRLKTVVVE